MALTYGAAWLRLWEGLEAAAVKAEWAEVLGGYADKPDALRYALEYLPSDRPPTVLQFRDLCRRAPEPTKAPELPGPKADNAVVARVVAEAMTPRDNKRPAERVVANIRRIECDGRTLTASQRHVLDACERHLSGSALPTEAGAFKSVPTDSLPPGMRA